MVGETVTSELVACLLGDTGDRSGLYLAEPRRQVIGNLEGNVAGVSSPSTATTTRKQARLALEVWAGLGISPGLRHGKSHLLRL